MAAPASSPNAATSNPDPGSPSGDSGRSGLSGLLGSRLVPDFLGGLPIPDWSLDDLAPDGLKPSELGTLASESRYYLTHSGLALGLGTLGRLWHLALSAGGETPHMSWQTIEVLQRRFADLLAADTQNVRDGVYPAELLHQFPLGEYLLRLPLGLLEVPRILWRKNSGASKDVPETPRGDYPGYYLQNFHWQSDGWLSDHSANLYDGSVEFLFGGTADIMRRMAIPPVARSLRGRNRPRVLDIGCGTGRFLQQLTTALPGIRPVGIDLSDSYLRAAAKNLADVPNLGLMAENAEALPFADNHFDATTSVFLFHELPRSVRRSVAAEAFRVIKPGGVFVACDSAQYSESAEIREALDNFPRMYHEPFYENYLGDSLEGVLGSVGFDILSGTPHLVSKVVVGRKPVLVEDGF